MAGLGGLQTFIAQRGENIGGGEVSSRNWESCSRNNRRHRATGASKAAMRNGMSVAATSGVASAGRSAGSSCNERSGVAGQGRGIGRRSHGVRRVPRGASTGRRTGGCATPKPSTMPTVCTVADSVAGTAARGQQHHQHRDTGQSRATAEHPQQPGYQACGHHRADEQQRVPAGQDADRHHDREVDCQCGRDAAPIGRTGLGEHRADDGQGGADGQCRVVRAPHLRDPDRHEQQEQAAYRRKCVRRCYPAPPAPTHWVIVNRRNAGWMQI